MKRNLIVTILTLITFTLLSSTALAAPSDYSWESLTSDGLNINKTPGKLVEKQGRNFSYTDYEGISVDTPTLIEYKDKLYGIWVENDDEYGVVHVKVYENGKWTLLDKEGLNYRGGKAEDPKAAVYNDCLYIMYQEYYGYGKPSPITLKKYDGKNWSTIKLDDKLFSKSKSKVYYYDLVTFKDKLYFGWIESTSNPDNAAVNLRSFDGRSFDKTTHVILDTPRARDIDLISDNDKIYVTFVAEDEKGFSTVRVAEFYGDKLNFIDTIKIYTMNGNNEVIAETPYHRPGVTAPSGGYNSVGDPKLALFKGELYLSFVQSGLNFMAGGASYDMLIITKYSEDNWRTVPASYPLNMLQRRFEHADGDRRSSSANTAYGASMLSTDDQLYITWIEKQPINDKCVDVVCIKAYNGESWDIVADGSQSTGHDAFSPQLTLYKGKPHIVWEENFTFVYVKGFEKIMAQ